MPDKRRKGREIMRGILGEEAFARREASTNAFNGELRRLTEEFALGEIWARPGLDLRTRSMLVVAMLAALGHTNELETHVRGAINNGCSAADISEVMLMVAAYAGFPAALAGTRTAESVLKMRGLL